MHKGFTMQIGEFSEPSLNTSGSSNFYDLLFILYLFSSFPASPNLLNFHDPYH